MPQRPQARAAFPPVDVLGTCNAGLDGYSDPTTTNYRKWAAATNVFSGAFGYVQRCRFANVVSQANGNWNNVGSAFTTLKYYAVPGLSSYLIGDINNQLFSFDSGNNYAQTLRGNNFVSNGALLAGPWSREVLQNILYEMNGFVKQTGRGANAAIVEQFGLDAPDATPQIVISAGSSQNITNIQRSNGVVTVTLAGALVVPGGNGVGMINVIITVGDTSFGTLAAGSFVVLTGSGTATLTWAQLGQNTALLTPTGTVDTNIKKSIGRSYSWAWENAGKPHIGAPSPSSQFILYNNQNGQVQLIQQGAITTTIGSAIVTGIGTAFTAAWVGRTIWQNTVGTLVVIIASVQSTTQLTLSSVSPVGAVNQVFQVFDRQATHVRLYATADGGATYFRVQRNTFTPSATTLVTAGLQFFDNANAEPPNFPYTAELSQLNNIPPPVGSFLAEYQGRLVVFGVPGAGQSFFYSNQELTTLGMPQESFAPLNQYMLPIQNASLKGWIEMPGSAIIWSD